jgi:sugar phosphate isomerase/epimerase
LKKIFIPFALMLIIPFLSMSQPNVKRDDTALKKLGWEIAVQAWTFKLYTLSETLDKLNELGVKNIEMYSKQVIGSGIEGTTSFTSSKETRLQLKALLEKKGIKAISYGVVKANSEEEWIQIFEFASDLGITTLVAEPEAKHMDLLETLCDKYKIKLGIHNHPKPSPYWGPDFVVPLITARTSKIGVSGDIGHWLRSGLDPVECVKKFDGRIVSMHFKDLNQLGVRDAHDIPWGTGNCNVAGVMHTLKNMNFKGVISVEYEYNWDNSVPDVKESLDYFYRVASQIAADIEPPVQKVSK